MTDEKFETYLTPKQAEQYVVQAVRDGVRINAFAVEGGMRVDVKGYDESKWSTFIVATPEGLAEARERYATDLADTLAYASVLESHLEHIADVTKLLAAESEN